MERTELLASLASVQPGGVSSLLSRFNVTYFRTIGRSADPVIPGKAEGGYNRCCPVPG